ncbi:hypothetical protein [Bradyrhizobium sp. 1(2017)]|uniref:hypothetical protein n=1 Tax=Bradyrhizobium sp. 1(2017) TaxID=1404888 RepID=UPI00140F02AE|nr:hypothetical protein [Bradyrhizobium sp. 1(2017)]QIO34335.1 hypothetical protein HAP40_22325 [Bradyrhizobium sp. 1(2017)]
MSDKAVAALRAHVARLEARVHAMETVLFKLSPSKDVTYLDSVEAVKQFLRKIDIDAMPPHVATFLQERLPSDWRLLCSQHGYRQTFMLLKDDLSIIEARRRLA